MATPAAVDLRPSFGPIRNQGPRPTCLAFAASATHEHARHHAEALSPEALFRGCENRDSLAAALGPTLSVALAAIQKDGQCDEVAWPYGDRNPSDQNAIYYRAQADAREQNDLNDFVSTSLLVGRSLLLVLQLTDAWHTVGTKGVIAGPSASDQQLGGHAVVAVGYDPVQQRVLIRNSWGEHWGDGGYAWLTAPYIESYVFEAVTLVALPESRSAAGTPTA